jgi:hypothetical protein
VTDTGSGQLARHAWKSFGGALHVAGWRETDFINSRAYAEEEAKQKQNL